MKKICIIGLGYIGLPTAAMFAEHECEVVGVDISPDVVDILNAGEIHIEEPGLPEVIKRTVQNGSFRASLVPEEADAFIIAVPTPNLDDEFLSCDLTYVIQGVESILPYIKKGNTIIVESTIAPKSTDDYIKPIFEQNGYKVGEDIYLAHCPERVLPGKILYELKYNNRIIGGITERCTEKAAEIYAVFVKGELIKTEAKTAELSKCMENTFRDVNIALANELAKICYKLDINCLDVIAMANKHPRVNIHMPGPGVGGHCLAIDPYFICAKAPEEAKIIHLSRNTNKSMPHYVVENIKMLLSNDVKNPKIALFGMAYKGNVDDVRESPAVEIAELLKASYNVAICEPHVLNNEYVDWRTAVDGADIAVILTDHDEFKALDYEEMATLMNNPILFDTRNIIPPQITSGLQVINFGNIYMHKDK